MKRAPIILIMITTCENLYYYISTTPTLDQAHTTQSGVHHLTQSVYITLMIFYVSGLSRRLLSVSILLCNNSLSVFNSSHSCCNFRI